MTNKPIVSRFAPSPTGRMHAGNIFTYLVNWIETKRRGGKVLLRIEDLDQQRSRQEYTALIMQDLELLGLTWDGEVVLQSERNAAYEEAYKALCTQAELYPCFCTRASIQAASAPHEGEQIVYPKTCYTLSLDERNKKYSELTPQNRFPSMRIHVPQEVISFQDVYQGRFTSDISSECGDFVIKRNDAGFSYNLAVVVDDSATGVNLVVRGCDLLPITPIQIYLQDLLGFSHPEYAHVPLLVTQDGRRIAKRDHDASLDEMLLRFKTPERLLGHIAFLAGLVEADEAYRAEELLLTARMDALTGKRAVVWH